MPYDLDRLQLAFAYRAVLDLVGADARIAGSELAFVAERFPLADLRAANFVDAEGVLTPEIERARRQAVAELPRLLTFAQKLALVELVADASAADGVLAPEEADALSRVARILGLEDRAWLEHLDRLIAAGRLHRDATGVEG
jgi:uncharacterized tellurite resistance protein B-like protein